MAARISRELTEEWRAKIQTSMLINRLNGYAMGEIELSSGQITAIQILLKKTLPDLSAVESHTIHEGKVDSSITVNLVRADRHS